MLFFLIFVAGFLFTAYLYAGVMYRDIVNPRLPTDSFDVVMCIVLGALMGILWPVTLTAYGVYKLYLFWSGIYGSDLVSVANRLFLDRKPEN
jgi:hypothetical protein